MNRHHLFVVALGLGLALPLAGCNKLGPSSRPVKQKTPLDWQGETSVDPAGDLDKLQGKWLAPKNAPDNGIQAWAMVEGDTFTFHVPFRERPNFKEGYKFVINSEANPKVIRLIQWLGPGKPAPGHQPPIAYWYSLEEDKLTLWNHYAAIGEGVKVTYTRINGK